MIEPPSNVRNYLPTSEMRRTALALAELLCATALIGSLGQVW